MSENGEVSETMKEYQIMLKVARAHMKNCPKFEKEVLREFELND